MATRGKALLALALLVAFQLFTPSESFASAPLRRAPPSRAQARCARGLRTARAALNPPPGKEGFLIGLRESIEYLVNGDKFIEDRTAEFGPVFSTTLFFRPTVVVGGQQDVAEFLNVDAEIAESSLPPPLQKLMTDKNVLLQTGERHSASRRMISPVLSVDALKAYLPTIEQRADEYIDHLARSDSTFLARDLTKFCLQLFAELFSGHRLTEEQEELFTTYNAGLFALSTLDPAFLKARSARETLEQDIQRKFEAARDANELDSARFSAFRHIASAIDENGLQSYSPGYSVTQFIWGAYIETASLVSFALINLRSQPECVEGVRAEAAAAGVLGGSKTAALQDWALPYTTGVLRESLRLTPPAGEPSEPRAGGCSTEGCRCCTTSRAASVQAAGSA